MSGCQTCGGFGNRHDPIAHGSEPATTPDPVVDVWEVLWTAACDYRDAAGPDRSEARLIDALMPVVEGYTRRIAARVAAIEMRAAADIPLRACCPEHARKRLHARADEIAAEETA